MLYVQPNAKRGRILQGERAIRVSKATSTMMKVIESFSPKLRGDRATTLLVRCRDSTLASSNACILQFTPSVSIDPVARKAKRNDRTNFGPSDVCPIMGSNLFCVWVDTVERRTAENDRGTSLLGLGPEGLICWLNSDRRQGE